MHQLLLESASLVPLFNFFISLVSSTYFRLDLSLDLVLKKIEMHVQFFDLKPTVSCLISTSSD